ncbi:MAG: uracil-DNA glycosylase [Candidatus Marinimicrobia bacterium]|nr:uracil-DNA glycosylase [Candidatus Neomarinimicrobiota bacterium]MBL7047028.1 uracil-DNA glycosylase [Candidatus Neomarinimicrobiota bacterium]
MEPEKVSPQLEISRYFSQMKEMYGDEIYVENVDIPLEEGSQLKLSDFEKVISDCQECHLSQTRTNLVFGVGSEQADLVFVGEAPGRDEDLQGEPFVGRAGQLLDRILRAIQLSRKDVYICNVLKCRPPKNRTPTTDEIDTCMPFLEKQLELIQPKLIVALGATAVHSLLNINSPLKKLRSQLWNWRGYDLVVTYHPAALLRNARLKPAAWEDFQWIKQLIH